MKTIKGITIMNKSNHLFDADVSHCNTFTKIKRHQRRYDDYDYEYDHGLTRYPHSHYIDENVYKNSLKTICRLENECDDISLTGDLWVDTFIDQMLFNQLQSLYKEVMDYTGYSESRIRKDIVKMIQSSSI